MRRTLGDTEKIFIATKDDTEAGDPIEVALNKGGNMIFLEVQEGENSRCIGLDYFNGKLRVLAWNGSRDSEPILSEVIEKID